VVVVVVGGAVDVVVVVGGAVDVVVVERGGWLEWVPELQEDSTAAAPSANVRLRVVVCSLLRARVRLLLGIVRSV
jgi:hypothetical protein